jgi:S1-C subfamily serine protease
MALLGMTLAEEEFPSSAGTRTGRTRGIVVREVEADSLARQVGIRPGDMVVEADNLSAGSLRELHRILASHPPLDPLYVLFLRHDRWQLKILYLDDPGTEHQ